MKTIVQAPFDVNGCARMSTMTLHEWIADATQYLKKSSIASARLDALVLLSFCLGKSQAHILAYPDEMIDNAMLVMVNTLLERRACHEPIAYLLGKKEFYGRDFAVTKDVLIPRPESEAFIDMLHQYAPLNGKRLLDVGTGSGALAITAKKENPKLQVHASDVSDATITIAKQNAKLHNADITFVCSNLLNDIHEDFDIIIANLPYVPPDYPVAEDLSYEPRIALYADHGGLALIQELLKQTPGKLLPGGAVLIECLQSQHADVIRMAKKNGLRFSQKDGLILAFTH